MEVTFRVKEVSREGLEGGTADLDIHALIRDPHEAPPGGTGGTKVRNKTFP